HAKSHPRTPNHSHLNSPGQHPLPPVNMTSNTPLPAAIDTSYSPMTQQNITFAMNTCLQPSNFCNEDNSNVRMFSFSSFYLTLQSGVELLNFSSCILTCLPLAYT